MQRLRLRSWVANKMQEASGVHPIVHFSSVAFMGFVNVVKNLRTITRIGKQVQEAILAFKPDVVIPVDFADFNLRFILPFTKKNLPETKVIYTSYEALGLAK